MSKSEITQVSDTAFWVSSYRARESEKPNSLFVDPFAKTLSGDQGQKIADSKSDSKYAEWTVVVRTRVIDDLINDLVSNDIEMVVNLGAGLDTRPYRLNLPSSLTWIEVDHPHVVEYKSKKLSGESSSCTLERVGLDLSKVSERQQLFDELNQRNKKTAILTEGVLPYLTENEVEELGNDLLQNNNFLYWITEYHSHEMYKHLRGTKKDAEMGNSPFRFFPDEWMDFFARIGWKERSLIFLGEEGQKLGRPFPLPLWAKLLFKVLPKKAAESVQKMSGFVVLERS